MGKRPLILIVDDDDIIIDGLQALLDGEGYDFVGTTEGAQALNIVREQKIDLVLLDILMPGMDGLKVCAALKRDERTKNIPVLMVTSLTGKSDRLMAMESGADDFLTKPVDGTELLIRVKSLLRIKAYYDELIISNNEIREKNVKLEQLEKAKNDLTQMIVHDLKGPLTAIVGNIDLALYEMGEENSEQMKHIITAGENCRDLQGMIDEILAITRLEEGKMLLKVVPSDLADITRYIMDSFCQQTEDEKISIKFDIGTGLSGLEFDPSIIRRVLFNLIDNAVRHTPQGGSVEIQLKNMPETGEVSWSIWNSGKGLPEEYHEKIFEKYEQVAHRKSGIFPGKSGLGLPFCKMAIEAHHGELTLESGDFSNGARFTFTLPRVGNNGM